MSNRTERIKNEPVVLAGVGGGGLTAVILGFLPQLWAALGSYGLEVTPELQALIAAILAILIPAAAAYIARRYVKPVRKLTDPSQAG